MIAQEQDDQRDRVSPSPAGEGGRRNAPDGWGKRPRSVSPSIVKRLRKNLTPQEAKLWVRLKEFREQKLHFRKQVPIKNYVVDFGCLSRKLLIELDGEQHGFDIEAAKDRARDADLTQLGYRVLRFWNHEVDREIESVLDTIWHEAELRRPHPSEAMLPTPSPAGEGGVSQ
jgi:very-short-patch-repair endonuclease